MQTPYIVEVVDAETDVVVKSIPCKNERDADKVDSGLNRQLNHDQYFTRIVPAKQVV